MKSIYYTIGQVSALTDLPQSVLRYWETVFDELSPKKSNGGSRQYSEEDIETIKLIKSLLYDQGFTIKGAAKKLKGNNIDKTSNTMPEIPININEKEEIIKEIKEIIEILKS